MNFPKLKDFLVNRMRMSHIYQPMIRMAALVNYPGMDVFLASQAQEDLKLAEVEVYSPQALHSHEHCGHHFFAVRVYVAVIRLKTLLHEIYTVTKH